ncbi:MAG: exodeoxyribonuclease VII large subunit, partial [Lachnoclostridium sp.]|nr:exodeoxyribonuclease VII large subunit [Lachnoclostridium sp.]
MNGTQALTLSQLNAAVSRAVASAPGTQNVWVVAETADVRVSGGHCYMELIEKDPASGQQRAKARANIWASAFSIISRQFLQATGRPFGSDMKVLVRVTASFHPLYGFSLNINAIDPSYTAGDLLRRRAEILARLKAEGILDMNRTLPWPDVPSRIAIISAAGAAGYGDFCRQLFLNPYRLRFTGRLFPAIMQGERSAESIIAALDAINADLDAYDCVVIIRGGGATSDLGSFESYDLAANIAQFPIPVIIGIGHERDITLLDYVANMRVKTPTAAAAWLVGRGADALA